MKMVIYRRTSGIKDDLTLVCTQLIVEIHTKQKTLQPITLTKPFSNISYGLQNK